ncbi:MAG TPA: hypothetical protein VMF50_13560 [Candidatus Binataceae bacterium]|nr:hypothetical protein [Candidatus Binataceae bacterium]
MQFTDSAQWSWTAGIAGIMVCLTLAGAGCAAQPDPLTVEVTQLAPYEHAAKPPDCKMPILDTLPLTSYEQVAIVEAWADLKSQPDQVLPALQRKACETGADALVVINSAHQDIKNLLYRATPNETETDIDNKNGYSQPGAYIQTAEHTRRLGEAGHNGFYIDAVAINYHPPSGKTAGSAADGSPNG